MKIITVPESKKLTKLLSESEIQQKHNNILNEGFFDDNTELLSQEEDDEILLSVNQEVEQLEVPRVEEWCKSMHIDNFEVICTGTGVVIDVHNHLYLPNRKLTKFPDFIRFRTVDGNCNLANNRFTSFKDFPRFIKGDLNANFNKICDFSYAPQVLGTVFAHKQNTHTKYKLTDANYKEYMKNPEGFVYEHHIVQIVPTGEYGQLIGINEDEKYAEILIEQEIGTPDVIKKVPLYNVEVLDGLQYLNGIIYGDR